MDQLKNVFSQLQNTFRPCEDDSFAFSLKNIQNLPIRKENFQVISSSTLQKSVLAVDSGSSEIIATPAWSLYYLRVCGVVFNGVKTKLLPRLESYVLISSSANQEEGKSVSFFNNHSIFSFSKEECKVNGSETNSFENKIFENKQLENKSSEQKMDTISFFRRCVEIRYASLYLSALSEGDIILLDGTLQTTNAFEEMYLEKLFDSAKQNQIIVGSIAKSCTLLTRSGKGVLSVLGQISPKEAWIYFPCVIAESVDHFAHIFFAKLHTQSSYIFRIELHGASEKFADSFFSTISSLAKDPVFLGYPYVLIEADMFARVTYSETELLRYDCMRQSGKDWADILSASRSITAHSVLDSIH